MNKAGPCNQSERKGNILKKTQRKKHAQNHDLTFLANVKIFFETKVYTQTSSTVCM
jgi:hypothetical protein